MTLPSCREVGERLATEPGLKVTLPLLLLLLPLSSSATGLDDYCCCYSKEVQPMLAH